MSWCSCRTEKRDRQREAKAEVAAQLEKSIEKELLERLQKGVYPTDIVNINMKEYEKVGHHHLLTLSISNAQRGFGVPPLVYPNSGVNIFT